MRLGDDVQHQKIPFPFPPSAGTGNVDQTQIAEGAHRQNCPDAGNTRVAVVGIMASIMAAVGNTLEALLAGHQNSSNYKT